mmetsp:Transcript_30644/g.78055  ORF Transcript_30644/g.78055 Transcript_30644/m.78055 type:complete len:202 (+) Transcript_30644:206-811(+)
MPQVSTPKIGALALSMSRDRSSTMRSCSLVISRISVMSCPTPITPVTSPFGPRRVVALSRISLRCPNLVNSGNSKLAASSPIKAASRTFFTDSLNSSVMKFATRSLPMVSARLKPSRVEALAFHSVTLPCTSMPKMGALAVSMSLVRSSATRLASAMTCFSSVISCPTPTTPSVLPSASQRAVALSSTVYCLPCFETRGSS